MTPARHPRSGQATITLTRRRVRWRDRVRSYEVLIDGTKVGRIGNGDRRDFTVTPGRRQIRLTIDWCSSPAREVTLAPGGHAKLVCEPRGFLLAAFLTPRKYIALEQTEPGPDDE